MATKAKGATANFDAVGYVSKNVHGGVRPLTGNAADIQKKLALDALVKAKGKLIPSA